MDAQPSRTGLAVSAIGGIVTAISVYQPWYGIGITQAGVGAAEAQISSVPGLARYAGTIGAAASGAVGRSIASVSAHQALHQISVILLIVAAAAILVSIVGLAGAEPSFAGQSAGGLVALGIVGALLTIFRMVDPPNAVPELITITLRFGAFASLAGCAGIVAGAMWPAPGNAVAVDGEPAGEPANVWSDLSGWTPS